MDYLGDRSLFDYLKKQPNYKMDENVAKALALPLFTALAHCHHNNIAHRDIKLENVIIDSNLNPFLIDFGFACVGSEKIISQFCGTPAYMAPEIVRKKPYYGPSADNWALGVLVYKLVTGFFPFRGKNSFYCFGSC